MMIQLPEKYAVQLTQSQNVAIQAAIQLLWRAWRYAKDTKSDPWQFAVELDEFRRVGVTKGELRWLVAHRYAVPALEVSVPTHPRRQFSKLHNVMLPDKTCFILVEAGLTGLLFQPKSQQRVDKVAENCLDSPRENPGIPQVALVKVKPHWNPALKSLQLGKVVVKQFRIPAPNQELVITAFQEAAWQTRIDDPLPCVAEQDPKRRLNDTIRCLNRSQEHELIRFRGDGTGAGVLWEARIPG